MKNKKIKKWKSEKKLPRILKINRVKNKTISVLFSDGQNRILDFNEIFKQWNISKKDREYILLDSVEFKKVKLEDFTLTWPNIKIELEGFNNDKLIVPYQIGPDTLYELSEPESNENIGDLIKSARIKAGITQEELGKRIGADKFYISRIENNRFKIELTTLKKIVEAGLHKKLRIAIK